MINQRNDAQGWRKQSRRRVGVCVCVTQTQAAHLWVKQSKGSVELRQTVVNRELGLGLTVLWVFFRFNCHYHRYNRYHHQKTNARVSISCFIIR